MSELEQTQTQTTQSKQIQSTLDYIEQNSTVSDMATYDMARDTIIGKTVRVTVQPFKGGPKYKIQAEITDIADLRIIAAIPLSE